jgi:hypothetical protein
MDVNEATSAYESWLGQFIKPIESDLATKHELMTRSPFVFLRATAFRWAQRWPLVCPELVDAPPVAAVGDLHVENFGTWRDAESRMAWGPNGWPRIRRPTGRCGGRTVGDARRRAGVSSRR